MTYYPAENVFAEARRLTRKNARDLSQLRGCDLLALRGRDVPHGGTVAHRAIVLRHKTQQPVQFELTDQTRESTVIVFSDFARPAVPGQALQKFLTPS